MLIERAACLCPDTQSRYLCPVYACVHNYCVHVYLLCTEFEQLFLTIILLTIFVSKFHYKGTKNTEFEQITSTMTL